jgi:hypothetical protein
MMIHLLRAVAASLMKITVFVLQDINELLGKVLLSLRVLPVELILQVRSSALKIQQDLSQEEQKVVVAARHNIPDLVMTLGVVLVLILYHHRSEKDRKTIVQ